MAEELDEFIEDFRIESHDSLGEIETQLLEMEGGDQEAVNNVFRAMHSLKGGSSFLDLINVNRLAHALENILDLVRQGLLAITLEMNDLLLRGADMLLEMIDDEKCGEAHDIEAILEETTHFLDHGAPAAKPTVVSAVADASFEAVVAVEQAPAYVVPPQETPAPVESASDNASVVSVPDSVPVSVLTELQNIQKEDKKPFGQFLIDKGYLLAQDVFKALIEQERQAKPDLEAFLEVGLNISDCMHIANIARQKMIHPLRVACELGYVTTDVMEQVNTSTQASRPPIGQTLRLLGYCDAIESKIWLQEYFDVCNGVETDPALYAELAAHQQQKAALAASVPVSEPAPTSQESEQAHAPESAPESAPVVKQQAPPAVVLPVGADIDCETDLIVDYQAYVNDELRTDVENMLLYFDSPDDHGVEEKETQLKNIFRVMHSLKGSSGFIGADATQGVVHHLEESITLIQRAPAALTNQHWARWVSSFLIGVDLIWGLCDIIVEERSEIGYIEDRKHVFRSFVTDMDILKMEISAGVQVQEADEDIDDLF